MDTQDLNFLYLMDALYREGSVSRAAQKLGLTHAVDHGLNRLRERFQDRLFVRMGAGMAPTPLGERIALGSRRALEMIRTDIMDAPRFDPSLAAHARLLWA